MKSGKTSQLGESLLSVEEALRLVIAESSPLDLEEVHLEESLGRVLAEAVVAAGDIPALDRSAMDGYALRSEDLRDLPAELDVIGFIPAGKSASGSKIGRGQAIRIMTGAPMPVGADAVQKVEETEPLAPDPRVAPVMGDRMSPSRTESELASDLQTPRTPHDPSGVRADSEAHARAETATAGEGGSRVRILSAVRAGENIFHRGSDLKGGATILTKGNWIRPAEIGALAAVGKVRVRVHQLPVVSVLSTGDEIVEPAVEPLPHQVRNSNGPALLAALTSLGIRPHGLGIARDDPNDLDRRIETGLAGDVLFLIGGVSVGDRDLVAERLLASGVRVIFHRIAMKPGKPLLFGRKGRCLVFGLPGNPLSALTDFLVFGLPAVRRLCGLPPAGLPEVAARLVAPVRQKPGRAWYRLARLGLRDGRFEATPVPSSGSGDLVSATRANGFIIVPADATALAEGDTVRALLWPGFEIG